MFRLLGEIFAWNKFEPPEIYPLASSNAGEGLGKDGFRTGLADDGEGFAL